MKIRKMGIKVKSKKKKHKEVEKEKVKEERKEKKIESRGRLAKLSANHAILLLFISLDVIYRMNGR